TGAAPFTLTGTGLANIARANDGTPLLGGSLPTPLDGPSTTDKSVTYRYYLQPKNTSDTTGLFKAGTVILTFKTASFGTKPASGSDKVNLQGLTQTFTLTADAAGQATTPKTIKLGPLQLVGPHAGIQDLGFKNGMLDFTVALGVDNAALAFGSSQGGSGVTATLTHVQGTFEVQFDAL